MCYLLSNIKLSLGDKGCINKFRRIKLTYFPLSLIGRATVEKLSHQALKCTQRCLL